MDRLDIDALLIGALYGELTPADEARLTAHLESHPADRGALDDLKVARAAVRESRIFELQAEPPQAVSALLLQEAHRRAPKRVVSSTGEAQESWFFRFTRVFMAHPAMAAAAMLVVVVGVFGLMQVNNRDAAQVAEKEYAPSAQLEKADDTLMNETAGAPTAVAEPASGSAAAMAMDPAQSAPADEGRDAKDSYRVGLDDATRRRDVADREEAAKTAGKLQREEQANKKSKGMIVTTPQPQPKELDAPRPKAATKAPAKSTTKSSTLAKGDYVDDLDGVAVGTAGGAGGAAAPRAGAGAGVSANDSGLSSAPQGKFAQPTAPSAAAPAPPPPPSSVATSTPTTTSKPTTAKQAQEKPAESKAESAAPAKESSLIAWAKSEHNRTVALANKGDCIAAAKLAVVVQNRAPDYYTQYMSTDRALKRCQAYIAQERDAEAERTGKARAQKRVNADEPAPTTTK